MQSNSFHFQTPISSKPTISPKIPSLPLPKSLKIPLSFHQQQPEEEEQEEEQQHSQHTNLNQLNRLSQRNKPSANSLPLTLPLVVKKDGNVCRYVWDGKGLDLVSVGGHSGGSSFGFDDWVGKVGIGCRLVIRDLFIPKKVSESYLEYVKWKFLHRVFSSALQVLATQAMFRAIGIGYSRSLPSAAALNWVLKDGLGRLSRCIYTASLASAFDTNLKRVRFSTSVIFSLSIGVELLTPIFPQHFLLLASIANIAKQISLACYLATGSAVHRSFAIADNIGEVSAKAQIQAVCFDNIGLLLAASLNMSLKNNQRLLAALPFVVYPIFTTMDLLGIYQGLKHVHLQTLTKDRLEIILDTWIECGYVPSPAEASKMEGIDIFGTKGAESWPIRIGTVGCSLRLPELSMMVMQSVTRADYYFICLENSNGRRGNGRKNILLCLREGAGTTDVIMGLLQACYMRQALRQYSSFWEPALEAGNMSKLVSDDWFTLAEDSKRIAQNQVQRVYDQISSTGWAIRNILLNTQEQARYSFVDD